MRILVCDDHQVFAESLGHLLAAMDVTVVSVTYSVNEALYVLRREPVDVCLLDVSFGTQSALPRISELRAASPDTRIVLLSGRVDSAMTAQATAAGVHAIADKSQPIAQIVRLVERVHAGQPVPVGAAPGRRPSRDDVGSPQRLAAYLTPREREIISALVRGTDTAMIARSMGITAATVRCHIQSALTKLGAHSRLEAATTAVRHGLVSPQTGEWLLAAG